jgi:hypothetical protein
MPSWANLGLSLLLGVNLLQAEDDTNRLLLSFGIFYLLGCEVYENFKAKFVDVYSELLTERLCLELTGMNDDARVEVLEKNGLVQRDTASVIRSYLS